MPDGKVDINDVFWLFPAWGTCDGCPEDVNGDGIVDIIDIVLVARHFGESIPAPVDPNPDANGDGVVDIQDIILVGQHFGETY